MHLQNIYKYLFLISLLQVFSTNILAEDKYGILYSKCINENGYINNTSVHVCSKTVSYAINKEINKLYDLLYIKMSKVSIEDTKKFENSQKNWLQYKKTHCELAGSYVGTPMYSYCPMLFNKSRLKELQELLN